MTYQVGKVYSHKLLFSEFCLKLKLKHLVYEVLSVHFCSLKVSFEMITGKGHHGLRAGRFGEDGNSVL